MNPCELHNEFSCASLTLFASQSSCYFAVAGAGQFNHPVFKFPNLTGCFVHTTAFLAYEYTITFDREVNLFWRRKLSMASILFGINRYLSLVGAVMNCPIPLPATLSDTVKALSLMAEYALTGFCFSLESDVRQFNIKAVTIRRISHAVGQVCIPAIYNSRNPLYTIFTMGMYVLPYSASGGSTYRSYSCSILSTEGVCTHLQTLVPDIYSLPPFSGPSCVEFRKSCLLIERPKLWS